MNNIFAVLLRMCDPIMDFDFTKLHLINADYLKQSKRLDLSKLTKLNATPDEEKSYFGEGDAMQVYAAVSLRDCEYATNNMSSGH